MGEGNLPEWISWKTEKNTANDSSYLERPAIQLNLVGHKF